MLVASMRAFHKFKQLNLLSSPLTLIPDIVLFRFYNFVAVEFCGFCVGKFSSDSSSFCVLLLGSVPHLSYS